MSKIILNSSKDWEEFEKAFGIKICAENIDHLVNLDNPNDFEEARIPRPIRPTFANYMAKVPSGNTKFIRGEEPAKSLAELLPEDAESLKYEWQIYRSDEARYKEELDSIRNILNWMNEAIAPNFKMTCSPDTGGIAASRNVAQFYFNLKRACGVDEFVLHDRARKRYSEVLKQALSPKTDWEDWITSWETSMQRATSAKVAEVQHPMTWFSDLVQHLKGNFNVFMSVEQSQHRLAISSGLYDPAEFVAHFRQEIINIPKPLELPTRARGIAKGSFGPTFQASTQHNNKRTESPNGYSREQPGKRPRTDASSHIQSVGDTCILCDRPHPRPNSSRCWVAFPENKPPRIRINENQIQEWERRLKSNKEVRELYSRIKKGEDSTN
jgi:hypothetical protein